MTILTVANPEAAVEKIHVYAAACTDDLIDDVIAALETLDIQTDSVAEIPELAAEIAHNLKYGRNYWLNESYCFEIISM